MTKGQSQLSADLLPSRLAPRVAVIYDNSVRPDTTGEYCRQALESMGLTVSHYLPGEASSIPLIYDFYFRVDDDLDYQLPTTLRPLAYWAIDTHRDYARRLMCARLADWVFCAQQNGAGRMRRDGIRGAAWLPLACDPEVHRRFPEEAKRFDVSFVGSTFPGDGERSRLVGWIRTTYPAAFVGQAYGEEMARIYSASRLVFNCAIRDDVNMRVFEAAACGSLLITNDLAANGQNLLFSPEIHLVTYQNGEELPALISRYLEDEAGRERMAEAGMRHAHAHHTYRHRMSDLLAAISAGADLDSKFPVPMGDERQPTIADCRLQIADLEIRNPKSPPAPGARRAGEIRNPKEGGWPTVSIVIPTFNQLALTRQCVASIRESTDVSYEILIVDNGSTDDTAAWARGEGLRVIANGENLGFPQACNQGMQAAFGEYLLILNNDTLVSPGWLSRLLAHARADDCAGLVAPSTNFANSCQQIPAQYASREEFLAFAEQIAREQAGQAEIVERLVGLCLLIPRRVVQEVGLLDTRFGLGLFEDDDYCLRIRMAGFRLLWARDVYIHHEGHQTFRSFTEEAYQRRMRENERLFREKWDLGRYFGTGGDGTPGVASAWDMLRAGRYPEAYDGFERMVQANPGDVRALLGLGLAAEGRGSPPAAELAYRTALALAPDDPDASRCLTRVRSRNGSR